MSSSRGTQIDEWTCRVQQFYYSNLKTIQKIDLDHATLFYSCCGIFIWEGIWLLTQTWSRQKYFPWPNLSRKTQASFKLIFLSLFIFKTNLFAIRETLNPFYKVINHSQFNTRINFYIVDFIKVIFQDIKDNYLKLFFSL